MVLMSQIWSVLLSGRGLTLVVMVVMCSCSPKVAEPVDGLTGAKGLELYAELPRSMASAPGQSRAAVYLVLHNPTATDAIITHISTPASGAAEVHRHTYEDGMMKMRQVSHARIPARGKLTFAPGGYHVMLLDLAQPLVAGGSLRLTIEFGNGHGLDIDVPVLSEL